MSANAAQSEHYAAAIARLAVQGRIMAEAEARFVPGLVRRELVEVAQMADLLAKRLAAHQIGSLLDVVPLAEQLADRVEVGKFWSVIEDAYGMHFASADESAEEATKAACRSLRTLASASRVDGRGGWAEFGTAPHTDDSTDDVASTVVFDNAGIALRNLADAARAAEKALPGSQARPVAPYLSLVFVHLRHDHGLPRPSTYVDSDDVQELESVLRAAGVGGTRERAKTLLVVALQKFDPHMPPGGYYEIA